MGAAGAVTQVVAEALVEVDLEATGDGFKTGF